jgi:fused signal recognition particle receptor
VDILYILLIALVVTLVVGAAYVGATSRGRRRGARDGSAPPAPRPSRGADRGSGTGTATRGATATPDDDVAVSEAEVAALEEALAAEPALETPEPAAGRLVRLRSRLARSQSTLGRGLLSVLSRDQLDDDAWDEIEATLLQSDLGVAPTELLVERLRTRLRVEGSRSAGEVRAVLREELLALVDPALDRSVLSTPADASDRPAVILVVGVNGTGKTTTTGKLARVLVADGRSVVLAAADTFRAAAAEQLQTWGERVGAQVVRGPEGGDPASVAFDAVKQASDASADVVLIDTAGRLHTKTGLMDELGKVKRVVEKQSPVDEVLLVLDATTGQNGLAQARVFGEVVDVTGVVLTKLDGTAKGGIVIAVQRELGVPVKLVGLGEGPDDLAPFEPEAFVDAILGDPA